MIPLFFLHYHSPPIKGINRKKKYLWKNEKWSLRIYKAWKIHALKKAHQGKAILLDLTVCYMLLSHYCKVPVAYHCGHTWSPNTLLVSPQNKQPSGFAHCLSQQGLPSNGCFPPGTEQRTPQPHTTAGRAAWLKVCRIPLWWRDGSSCGGPSSGRSCTYSPWLKHLEEQWGFPLNQDFL